MTRWLLLFVVVLISCKSNTRITREEFGKIKDGMSTKEVKSILGEPDEIRPNKWGTTMYVYITRKDALTLRNAIITIDNITGQVSSSYYEIPD